MKKQYMKPSMKVYNLQHRTMILCGSDEKGIPSYDDDYGYIPRIGDGSNHLA